MRTNPVLSFHVVGFPGSRLRRARRGCDGNGRAAASWSRGTHGGRGAGTAEQPRHGRSIWGQGRRLDADDTRAGGCGQRKLGLPPAPPRRGRTWLL